jgi:DTW domain-containing protein YfiP
LALQLIQQAIDDYHARHEEMSGCFCFAESRLQQLYEHAGFSRIVDSTATPDWMWKSFEIIAKRMKRKHQDMQLFVKKLRDTDLETNGALNVILLQHSKERSRMTSTAPLLSDNEHVKRNETFQPLSGHVNVEILSWSGRKDNGEIEQRLGEVRGAVLVWTGGNITAEAFQNKTTAAAPSFVILDGTWQEARTMFRKLPALQQLPRLSLSPQWSSIYTLRKDFTGWRDRFGGSDDNLLCTAKAVAALLDHRGDNVGRDIVLHRLQKFQHDFGKK